MAFVPYDFTKDSFLSDPASATVTYFGFYDPQYCTTSAGAVDQSVAQFLIVRQVVDGSGNVTSFKWASRSYNQIWADRASLTYV